MAAAKRDSGQDLAQDPARRRSSRQGVQADVSLAAAAAIVASVGSNSTVSSPAVGDSMCVIPLAVGPMQTPLWSLDQYGL
jgi:hypothetical protein